MIMESGEFWEVCVGMYPELAGDSGFGKLKPSDVRGLVERAWEEGYAARTRDTKAAQEIMDATLQCDLAAWHDSQKRDVWAFAHDELFVNGSRFLKIGYFHGPAREEEAGITKLLAALNSTPVGESEKIKDLESDVSMLKQDREKCAEVSRSWIYECATLTDEKSNLERQLADRDGQNGRQAQTIHEADRVNAELEAEVARLTNRLREMCNEEPAELKRQIAEKDDENKRHKEHISFMCLEAFKAMADTKFPPIDITPAAKSTTQDSKPIK